MRNRYAARGDLYDLVRLPGRAVVGEAEIRVKDEEAGAEVPLNTVRCRFHGQDRPWTVRFDEPTRWHYLHVNDVLLMSDLPVEVAQHRENFDRMQPEGRVLVGGLGVGLTPVMLAREHPAVEHVTVVEVNQDVVDLVAPQVFERLRELGEDLGKLRIVTDDVHRYVRNSREKFDFAFYDIWSSDGESTFHEHVLPLRRWSRRLGLNDDNVFCWNEDIMRAQLYWSLTTRGLFLGDRDWSKPENGKHSVWINWSAPFFQIVKKLGFEPGSEKYEGAANFYTYLYGRPGGWLNQFKEIYS